MEKKKLDTLEGLRKLVEEVLPHTATVRLYTGRDSAGRPIEPISPGYVPQRRENIPWICFWGPVLRGSSA